MKIGFDNYLEGQLAANMQQLDERDHRQAALDHFIMLGKERVLSNREFAGLSFKDFAQFVIEFEVHGQYPLDGLIKFAICHEPDATGNNAQMLMAHQAFLKSAFDDFIESKMSQITAAFEAQYIKAA